jgi:hypothetical protein
LRRTAHSPAKNRAVLAVAAGAARRRPLTSGVAEGGARARSRRAAEVRALVGAVEEDAVRADVEVAPLALAAARRTPRRRARRRACSAARARSLATPGVARPAVLLAGELLVRARGSACRRRRVRVAVVEAARVVRAAIGATARVGGLRVEGLAGLLANELLGGAPGPARAGIGVRVAVVEARGVERAARRATRRVAFLRKPLRGEWSRSRAAPIARARLTARR